VFGAIGYRSLRSLSRCSKGGLGKRVMYGKTMVSDAIAKAVLGEDLRAEKHN